MSDTLNALQMLQQPRTTGQLPAPGAPLGQRSPLTPP